MGFEVDQIITEFVQRGVGGLRSDLRAIHGDMSSVEGRAERLSRVSDRLIGFGAAGAGAFALISGASLRAKGDMQVAEIGFKKALGSQEAALRKLQELREFDRESPLNFKETVKGAQRLLAVGFAADGLKSTLTDIGDATVGTGGNTSDFMGIGRALGQMKSKGKVSMEEINQLADRNVPALQILQKQLKLTDDQLADLMKGDLTIDANQAIPALLAGFRELYGGSMKEGAKTLPGQVSNLNSALFQLGETVGGLETGPVSVLLETLTNLTDKTNDLAKQNPELAQTMLLLMGGGGVGLVGLGVAGKVAGSINDIKTLTKSKKGAAAAADLLARATKADSAAELAKAAIAGKESVAIDTVSDAVQIAAGAKGKLAARTLAGVTASAAAAKGALSLADATLSYGKAANAAETASSRLSKASSLRGRLAAQLAKTETALENVRRTKLPADPLKMVDAQKKIVEDTMRLEARRAALRSRLNRVGTVADKAKNTLETANASKSKALEAARGQMSLNEATAAYGKAATTAEEATHSLSAAQSERSRIAAKLAQTEEAIAKRAANSRPSRLSVEKGFKLGAEKLSLQNQLVNADEAVQSAKGTLDAAKFQKQLALEAAKAGTQVAQTTEELGKMAKLKNFLSKPLMPKVAPQIPKFAMKPFIDPITGAEMSSHSWNAAKLAAWNPTAEGRGITRLATPTLEKYFAKLPGIGKFASGGGEAVIIGGAGMAGLGGLLSGITTAQNYEAAGYEKGDAYMRGAATGIGVAAASLFVPGGPIAVAIGEGIGGLVNYFYTEPIERATSEGTGPKTRKETVEVAQMSAQEKADYYFKKRDEALVKGDGDTAASFMMEANSQQKRAKEQQKAAEDFALNQRLDEFRKEHSVNKDYKFNRLTRQYDFTPTRGDLEQRSDEQKKAIAESKARDLMARTAYAGERNVRAQMPEARGLYQGMDAEQGQRLYQQRANRFEQPGGFQGEAQQEAARRAYEQQFGTKPDSTNPAGFDVRARQTAQRTERNGNTRTKIEVEVVQRESPGDKVARTSRYNTLTAAPNYQ